MLEKKDYPKPAYTADNLIILIPDELKVNEKILLIKRLNDPFKDCWALPGGYVNPDETSSEAARREAKEETNVDLPGLPKLIGIFDKPGRDPRGWVISAAYRWYVPQYFYSSFQAGDDAKEAQWFSLHDLPENMAFDHLEIIKKYLYKDF